MAGFKPVLTEAIIELSKIERVAELRREILAKNFDAKQVRKYC